MDDKLIEGGRELTLTVKGCFLSQDKYILFPPA